MNKESGLGLISIQPYFIIESNDFCQSVLFENGISHFFSFSNKSDSDITVPLVVDGCCNLIFEYKGNFVRTHFIGSTVETRTFSVKKYAEYFGVRLLPIGSDFIKEISIKETVGKIIIIDEIPSMKNFCKKMAEQKDNESRMKIFLEEYPKFRNDLKKNNRQKELFKQIYDLIIQRKGKIKVSELEALSGYSSRYINKIFENEIGFSPKQFCRCVKFQFLLGELNLKKEKSWTTISSEYNFYDQSHFNHEFKEYSGKTPSEYFAELESIQIRKNIQETKMAESVI